MKYQNTKRSTNASEASNALILAVRKSISIVNGFDHLIRKGKEFRPAKAQSERLSLIPNLKTILGGQHENYVEYRSMEEKGVLGHFWAFRGNASGIKVKIVVRQIDYGQKHFFSAFPIKH